MIARYQTLRSWQPRPECATHPVTSCGRHSDTDPRCQPPDAEHPPLPCPGERSSLALILMMGPCCYLYSCGTGGPPRLLARGREASVSAITERGMWRRRRLGGSMRRAQIVGRNRLMGRWIARGGGRLGPRDAGSGAPNPTSFCGKTGNTRTHVAPEMSQRKCGEDRVESASAVRGGHAHVRGAKREEGLRAAPCESGASPRVAQEAQARRNGLTARSMGQGSNCAIAVFAPALT